ncbi:MAG: M20 family peptidase [Hyphomonadaceae bacterium]|nr:M20 family peptidase [Hyphomonadaceae bacterium]
MLKKIGLGLAGLFAVLVAVVLVRTFTYGGTSDLVEVELPAPPEISTQLAAQHLSEAIQFRTITVTAGDPRPGTEGPWLDLHAWLEATYPAAHAAMTRETVADYTLLYTWAGSDPSLAPLLLMAHQDVVPVNIGTEGDWTAPPFSGEIIDGVIYGRGAIDDKGSLVALMEAAEALAASGFQPRRTIHFLFGHDEEVSGSGAEAGIALLKSRNVSPVMALDEGFMVINPSPLSGGPMAYIGVAEKGYLSVSITAVAEGGHSSTPPRNSAAVRLSRALVALDETQMPADFSRPPVKELFEASAGSMPFLQKMALANLWLFGGMVEGQMAEIPAANAMIRTTTAPTMLVGSAKENVLAQRATAVVNFRIHPNDSEADVLAHIRDVTGDIDGLEIEQGTSGIRGQGASPVSATDTYGYGVLAAIAREAGDGADVAPGLVLGATDGRYATAITDAVYRFAPAVLSPAELTGFHGTNERTSVENMGRMARGYAQLILAMDAGE